MAKLTALCLTLRCLTLRCLILWLAVLSPAVTAGTLRVAVAANFKPVLDVLAEQFEQKHDTKVLVSSASSGILYNQISHGAPFDLFLSADDERPERLEQDGLIVQGSRVPYAYGRLVLWDTSGRTPELEKLNDYQGRLAIANPALAPYGLAARQTLEQLGLWQGYQRRLVQGASIQQAWQFVASGNVRVGLVAKAQVLDEPAAQRLEIPEHFHDPIRQELVILKRGNQTLAKSFSDYLLSESSQALIKRQGYRPAK